DRHHMRALGAAVEPLGLEHAIHLVDIGKGAAFGLRPFLGIRGCGGAAAFEARTVTGGECRHLVEEEQVRIGVRAPYIVPASLERWHAADPVPRGIAAGPEGAIITIKAPAAIAEHRAARRRRDQLAERRHTILQRHGCASAQRLRSSLAWPSGETTAGGSE